MHSKRSPIKNWRHLERGRPMGPPCKPV